MKKTILVLLLITISATAYASRVQTKVGCYDTNIGAIIGEKCSEIPFDDIQ